MPVVKRNNRRLEYRVHGDGPTVALLPEACVGPWSWGWVIDTLHGGLETVVYRSVPPVEANGIATLAADLEAILSDIGCNRVHLAGSGMGGQIALQYAAQYDRARSLLLLGTGIEGPVAGSVRKTLTTGDPIDSLRPYLGDVIDRLDAETIIDWRSQDDPDAEGRKRALSAAASWSAPPLYELPLPARVCHGDCDNVWPIEQGANLAERLPAASFERVLEAPHLLPVAVPRLVTDELWELITNSEGDQSP